MIKEPTEKVSVMYLTTISGYILMSKPCYLLDALFIGGKNDKYQTLLRTCTVAGTAALKFVITT